MQTDNEYELRWFTPRVEIDLCGHATLASASAVFEYVNPEARHVDFQTKSGRLSVKRRGDLLIMDFPARQPVPCQPPDRIDGILGYPPIETLRARDLLAVYEEEEQIRIVSRFFAPGAGIPEDPVTGSSHCTLIPYWSRRLGKKELHALQLSERGGELFCAEKGERVAIGGRAVTYMSGIIRI